jgi:hypothetical protein
MFFYFIALFVIEIQILTLFISKYTLAIWNNISAMLRTLFLKKLR